MESKELGARHGATARRALEAAKHLAHRVIARCQRRSEPLAGYASGFAQALLRPKA